jgi:hypothetical protein
MRRFAGAHLGRLQLLVAALAGVVAVTGQPVAAQSAAQLRPADDSVLSRVTQQSPLRIAASGAQVRDAAGRAWKPDADYAQGGRLVASAHPIEHTASGILYQRARLGASGYDLPVGAPGTYFVDMFVAETRGALVGQRVWDVTAEGRTVAQSVDVAQMAGHNFAGHVLFRAAVIDGTLNLRIKALHGMPLIGAIEVDWLKSETFDRVLFKDDFTGPAGRQPDPLRWTYDTGGGGFGNGERQTYTSRPSNVALDGNGHLFITARQEEYTGADGIKRAYTSARIKTANLFTFKYGTASARIQVPRGAGLWPAFWALGDNFQTADWPSCGEIDVMENRGSQPRVTHGTVHGATTAGSAWQSGRRLRLPVALSRTYRTFQLMWGPSAIGMSVDGRTYSSVSKADIPPGAHWNFDHKFFLLLNLAVGGTWPGLPTSATEFPAIMAVDYVNVRG